LSTEAPEPIAKSASAIELLAQVPERSGLCCDFDGTISPIVVDPESARPLPGAVAVLHALAGQLALVAVVSGRSAEFLAERLELSSHRSPLRAVGLHGLEEAFPDGSVLPHPAAATWRPALETILAELATALPSGVRVEDKGYGITVHWRSSSASGAEREAIAELATEVVGAIAARQGVVVRPGKASVEIALPLGVDKGTAVRELCGGLDRVGFLGDDAGDLLAFKALDELRITSGLFTVKIAVAGDEVPPALVEAADIVLDGPSAAVGFLVALSGRLGAS